MGEGFHPGISVIPGQPHFLDLDRKLGEYAQLGVMALADELSKGVSAGCVPGK